MVSEALFPAVLPFPPVDPVLFRIGPFALRWYALAYIAGFVFASWYMKRLVANPALWGRVKPSMSVPQVDDFFLWSVLGVVLGGPVRDPAAHASGASSDAAALLQLVRELELQHASLHVVDVLERHTERGRP